MAASDYGIYRQSYEAGSLYEKNIGVRDKYDENQGMLNNSLLTYYLTKKLEDGLIVEKGATKDIICLKFNYSTKSYEETRKIYKNRIENADTDEEKEKWNRRLCEAEIKKDLYEKKDSDELRAIFYKDGIEIKWGKRKNEFIHYNMLFRSTGKAKAGECMFICDRLYEKAKDFMQMGLKLPEKDVPIVELCAYSSLIASSTIGMIKIPPEDIFVMKDVDSFFRTNVVSVETDENKHCYTSAIDDYELKNTMFDGQGLIDESVFPKYGHGYVLLRQHFCKMACFKTKIQKFFKDYYGADYETATLTDMFGIEHKVKDIKLITTDNSMKWLKFLDYGASYEYWCEKVHELDCYFGVVKTAHKSKLGDVQKMSYQMVNSLYEDVMSEVVQRSVDYIKELKTNDEVFMKYLRDNKNFSNDYEVLVDLCKYNSEFKYSEYFRDRKYKIIEEYVRKFRNGKVIQNADNLVFVGSPYAMLLHTVGESVEDDYTLKQEDDCIQCFTTRFDDGEYLATFRSPHNSRNNILYLHNHYNELFFKYFDLGEQILVLNTLHTDVQDRANG